MYYRITENILNFVLFNRKSYGYECGIYIQPLYIPNDTLVLDLGDSMRHIDFAERKKYDLDLSMSRDEIESNLHTIIVFFKKTAVPWFEKIGTPEGVCKHILGASREAKILWTEDKWKYEARAYSELYVGNYRNAVEYFEKFTTALRQENVGDWVEKTLLTINKIITAIDIDMPSVKSKLIQTAQDMKKLLRLEDTD
jgi:hypothetical protein